MNRFWFFLVSCLVSTSSHGFSIFSSCPTTTDLDQGLVITHPASKGEILVRYRRLDGPLIGHSYMNGIFADRGVTISYAGLFTYKAIRGGKVVQLEEPKTDLNDLLKFEVGTKHDFASVRSSPDRSGRKLEIAASFFIDKADDYVLSNCSYRAVRIRREGVIRFPDGKVKRDNQSFLFVPDLLLKVAGSGISYGNIEFVRQRSWLDKNRWPFTDDADSVLEDSEG